MNNGVFYFLTPELHCLVYFEDRLVKTFWAPKFCYSNCFDNRCEGISGLSSVIGDTEGICCTFEVKTAKFLVGLFRDTGLALLCRVHRCFLRCCILGVKTARCGFVQFINWTPMS